MNPRPLPSLGILLLTRLFVKESRLINNEPVKSLLHILTYDRGLGVPKRQKGSYDLRETSVYVVRGTFAKSISRTSHAYGSSNSTSVRVITRIRGPHHATEISAGTSVDASYQRRFFTRKIVSVFLISLVFWFAIAPNSFSPSRSTSNYL